MASTTSASLPSTHASGTDTPHDLPPVAPPFALLALVTVGLFAVWSLGIVVADGLLLKPHRTGGVLDWWELILVRYSLIAISTAAYVALFRFREAVSLVRRHPVRMVTLAAMMVPGYNVFILFAQSRGLPPGIAALSTVAAPLFMMILGRIFLDESIGPRKVIGFVIAFGGMALIAFSKGLGSAALPYPSLVLIALGGPVCWSIYSTVIKPLLRTEGPMLILFVALSLTGLPLVFFIDGDLWQRLLGRAHPSLGAAEWAWMAFLVVPCALVGFPLWNWVLKHLPASTAGFAIFLSPVLAFLFAYLLHGTVPETLEIVGSAIVLTGVGVVIARRLRRA